MYTAGDKFQVQLHIKNEGNRNQTHIKVTQLLPANATTDLPANFEITQLVPNEEYVKNITLTIKDRAHVYKALKSSAYRIDVRSEVGTVAGDFTSYFTINGTKVAAQAASGSALPNTGMPVAALSLISVAVGALALGMRKFARGY
jgi:uncharacterized membrane protein